MNRSEEELKALVKRAGMARADHGTYSPPMSSRQLVANKLLQLMLIITFNAKLIITFDIVFL